MTTVDDLLADLLGAEDEDEQEVVSRAKEETQTTSQNISTHNINTDNHRDTAATPSHSNPMDSESANQPAFEPEHGGGTASNAKLRIHTEASPDNDSNIPETPSKQLLQSPFAQEGQLFMKNSESSSAQPNTIPGQTAHNGTHMLDDSSKPPKAKEVDMRASVVGKQATQLENAAPDGEAALSQSYIEGSEAGMDDGSDLLMLEGLEDLLAETAEPLPPSPGAVQPPATDVTYPGNAQDVQESSQVLSQVDTQTQQMPVSKQSHDASEETLMADQAVVPTDAQVPGPSSRQSSVLQGRGHALSRSIQQQASGYLPGMSSMSMPDKQEEVLQQAEALERSLLTAAGSHSVVADANDVVTDLLGNATEDWPKQGRPDASGAMVGGSVALKLEEIMSLIPELKAALLGSPASHQQYGSTGGHSATSGPYGAARVITMQGTVIAVGTSLGVTLAAQMPSLGAAAAAAASAGQATAAATPTHKDSSSAGGNTPHHRGSNSGASLQTHAATGNKEGGSAPSPPLLVMGEPRSEAEAVTAVGFSRVEQPSDPLWLLVGHASGSVGVWELQRRGPRLLTVINGQHGLPVTHVSFIPGRGVTQALTVDRRGRLVVHSLSSNMLLMRTAATSKPLLDGSLGIITDVVHLQPFPGQQQPLPTETAGHRPATPLLGDGVAALCTPTGCHIARFRPSGDLTLLMVVPKPDGVTSLPCAAWAQHVRSNTPPTTLTAQVQVFNPQNKTPVSPTTAGTPAAPVFETVTVPCATIAVSWGQLVLFCDIPLLGDHKGAAQLSDIGAAGTNPSGTAATAAAAGPTSPQAMGLSLLRTVTAAATATASRVTNPGVDPLMLQTVKQLAAAFPIQVLRKWDTRMAGKTHTQDDGQANQADEMLYVLGLHWFDGEALGVVLQQGLQVRLAVLGPDLEVREQVDCFDTPMTSLYLPSNPGSSTCCPGAVAGYGSRIVMLGSSGTLHCCRLMAWQERLRTLQDVGKIRLSLWYGLEFYKMHLARRVAATAAGVPPAPSDVTTAQQQAEWLLGLLLSHTQTELQACLAEAGRSHTKRHVSQTVIARCKGAAQLGICCCLLLGLQTPLTEQLFQLFQTAEAELGKTPLPLLQEQSEDLQEKPALLQPLGIFLEALEPHILADRLPCLAPEVVYALVNYFAVPGPDGRPAQPQRVERCVLHLDVFHLDLDQVLRLCTSRGLFSALIYVSNRIGEYRQPVLDMLAYLAGLKSSNNEVPSHTDSLRVARKLLVYLRCVFRGEAFPPGSGELSNLALAGGDETADLISQLKGQLLGLLLFTDTQDLAREWRVPLQTIQATVSDPYPCLWILLSADPPATVHVLGQAVDGWDAVETELRAAAGKPAQELDSVLVATQVLVNALVSLLDRPAGLPHSQQAASLAMSAQRSQSCRAAILDFVTALVASRRVTVVPAFLLQLLQHVLQPPAGSTVLQLQVSHKPVGFGNTLPLLNPAVGLGQNLDSTSNLTSDEMLPAGGVDVQASGIPEQLAICLIDVVGVNPVVPTASTYQAPDRLNAQESLAAIQLLLQHGMRAAAAHVYHLRGEVQQALALHLQLPQQDSPFLYIHSCLQTGQLATRQAVLAALLASGKQLAQASPPATAAGLLALDPSKQTALLQLLADQPAVRFQVLRALMALTERLYADGQLHGMDDEDPDASTPAMIPSAGLLHHSHSTGLTDGVSTMGLSMAIESPWGDTTEILTPLVTLLLPQGSSPVPRSQDLRSNADTCHDFVALACKYAPSCVLPFLLRHTVYDVRKCLAAVQQAGILEANAYLLERLGELSRAFQLHLSRIAQYSSGMERVIKDVVSNDEPPCQHVVWLLALSPRLRTSLSQVCGQEAYSKAMKQYEEHRRQYSTSWFSSGALPQTGQKIPQQQTASQSHNAGQRRVDALRNATPGATNTHGDDIQRQNQANSYQPVPPGLCAFWAALCSAVAFCTRCSRQARTAHTADKADTAHDATSSRNTPQASGSAAEVASYWLQLLEVYVQHMRSQPNIDTFASSNSASVVDNDSKKSAFVLRQIYAAAVEEVVASASDHVPLSDLVMHISAKHGTAAVGEFRSMLAGLLSACSYEQAIMQAALRLIAHDALAIVRARCAHNSSGLLEQEVETAQETADGVNTSTGSRAVGSNQATASSFALVTDQVHHSLLTSISTASLDAGQRAQSSKPAAHQVPMLVIGGTSSSATGAMTLATAGLNPSPPTQRGQLRATAGDFQQLSIHNRSSTHARINLGNVLSSLGLPSTSVLHQPGYHTAHASAGASSTARDGSFDVDTMLIWATNNAFVAS